MREFVGLFRRFGRCFGNCVYVVFLMVLTWSFVDQAILSTKLTDRGKSIAQFKKVLTILIL
jgi:hypothetical protein